jgi:predicted RNA methylase
MIWTTSFAFDIFRNEAYINYIKDSVKDKVVVDCGAGSGIWTWVALYYGASHVFSIDLHPKTLEHLNVMFGDNSNVTVMALNIFEDRLPAGDIYIHEIFAANPFGEGLLTFLKNCHKQNITNLFPSNLELYAISGYNVEHFSAEYDISMLQNSIYAFLADITEKYNTDIDVEYYTKNLTRKHYTWEKKEVVWTGHLLDLVSVPNINVKEMTAWSAGNEKYNFSPLNGLYSSWGWGAIDSWIIRSSYLKFARLSSNEALHYSCTNLKEFSTSSSA